MTFQQLSSEHHAGHELWITNATGIAVHCMQMGDRSVDVAPTALVSAEAGSAFYVTGLFSYYAAKVPSGGFWPRVSGITPPRTPTLPPLSPAAAALVQPQL